MNVLLWFRRDLRMTDHSALAMAAAEGAVLPLFVADPDEWSQADRSARQWTFVAECLADLRDALGGLSLSLVLRRGGWRDVMATLVRAYDIGAIFAHAGRDAWEQAQDQALSLWAAERGLRLVLCDPVDGVVMPAQIAGLSDVAPGIMPEARALGLKDDPCPQRQRGGRARGLRRVEDLVDKQLAGFHAAQKRGDPTRNPALAAHLAWGSVTAADLTRAMDRNGVSGEVTAQDRKAFLDLARWTPATFFPWKGDEPPQAGPWTKGQTGWPFVDAAMRALRITGTLPPAVLLHLARIGTGPCGLSESLVLTHLSRLLTARVLPDSVVQGLKDASQMGRIMADPARFGEMADPQGRFILGQVPELRGVPMGFIHRPWDWMQEEAARSYPLPVYRAQTAVGKLRITQRIPRMFATDIRQAAFDFGPHCVSAVAAGSRSA